MRTASHLYRDRNGTFYIRTTEKNKTVKKSLKTKDLNKALFFSHLTNLLIHMKNIKKLDVVLNGIEFRNVEEKDYAFIKDLLKDRTNETTNIQNTIKQHLNTQKTNKLFSEVVNIYLTEKALENTKKTIEEKASTYNEFLTYFNDVDFSLYDKSNALAFKSRLISSKISALRINKKLSMLKDLFNFSINNNLYFDKNPFETISISKKSKLKEKVKSYKEFTDEELIKIFDKNNYSFLDKPNYHWLPILALFTGARIEELASLKTNQIKQEEDIYFIELEKAKNFNSIRKIPIHSKLIELGFIKYFEKVKDKEQLFPELKTGKNGFSKNCSRRFGQYLDKILIKDSQKVFHSFRSTFINRLTLLNIHPSIIMAIVGHYEQTKLDFSSAHFKTYQQEKPIKILKQNIDRLSFDFLFKDW
jgi:integrase